MTDNPLIFPFHDISTPNCPLDYSFKVLNDQKILPSIKLLGRTFKVENRYDLGLTHGENFFDYDIQVIASMGEGCVKAESTFSLRVHNPCVNTKYVEIVDTSESGLDSIQYEIGSGELDFALESDMFEVQTWPIEHDLCGPLWSTSTFKSKKLDSLSWPVSYQIKHKKPTWTIEFDDDESDEDAYLAGIEAGKSYPYTLRVQLAHYPLQSFIELEDRI